MTDKNIPSDYRQQNGCYNCKHIFCYWEPEMNPIYCCTLLAWPRPMTLEEAQGAKIEYYEPAEDEQTPAEFFDEWANQHEVDECGICGKWAKNKKLS